MSFTASILVRVTATMGLALLATQLARRRRASARHVLLGAGFAIVAALPLAGAVAPPVRIAVPIAAAVPLTSSPVLWDAASSSEGATAPIHAGAASTSPRVAARSLPWLPVVVWSIGAAVFLLRLLAGLRQTRVLKRSGIAWRRGQSIADAIATESGSRPHASVYVHDAVPGPLTCGVVRPAIVLPVEARSWGDEDLQRAIAHELEHVRRADWVTQSIARAVAACYWFHPLVWLAWRRFALEAERACDDAVLRRAEPTAYADQLVLLAQRMLDRRRPSAVAMAGRRDLQSRVRALLDARQARGPAGTAWIATVVVVSAILVVSMSAVRIVTPAPQSRDEPAQRFEVASVKPCKEEPFTGGQRRPEFRASPDRVTIDCIPLARIIYFAYAGIGNLQNPLLNNSPADPDHVRGGPGWIRSERFTIEGKASGPADRTTMMGPMLRALLEDRFDLKTHRETEDAPMYELKVAKGGLKIQPIDDDGCTSFEEAQKLTRDEMLALDRGAKPVCGNFTALGDGVNRTWHLGGETMVRFADSQLSSVLDRHVIDGTGVSGRFNIHLTFGLDESIRRGVFGGAGVAPPPSDIERGPSIFTALEEQLGLKLEKTRGPRQFLVVDHVERPQPN